MSFDELLERDAHRLFHGAGPVDVAADAVEFGATVVDATKAGKPVRAPPQDGGDDSQCLHIVDGGGATKQADVSGVRWLHTRLALRGV